jgi:hypothetical protein
VCWSIVVKDKPTVVSPFFGVFPSGCIPKAKKDYWCIFIYSQFNINVLRGTILVNYISGFQGLVEATAYYIVI